MARKFASIDDYISSFPEDVQVVLQEVRRTLREAAPAAEETISYQMPALALGGKYVVSFAAWKNHLAIYPTPTGDEAFEQAIAPYRTERSTSRFPLREPIPHDLIRQIATICLDRR